MERHTVFLNEKQQYANYHFELNPTLKNPIAHFIWKSNRADSQDNSNRRKKSKCKVDGSVRRFTLLTVKKVYIWNQVRIVNGTE
jgi:hypothetical protein